MPAGGSRSGRRDNGLTAADYAAVGDIDPRVGEHLLDVLAGDGIAAYLLPATDLHPITRTTTLPAVPTDRLYADREHLGTAKEYLERLRADESAGSTAGGEAVAGSPTGPALTGPVLPGPVLPGPASPESGRANDVDMEAAWADIIAAYDAEIDDKGARWPANENLPDRAPDDTDPDLGSHLDLGLAEMDGISDRAGAASDWPATRRPDEPTLLDALDTFGGQLPATDEEGYTPPPPPPVPRPSRPVILALLGVVGGVVLFFSPNLLPIDSDVTQVLGFASLLGGVVTLIWRLRPGDTDDEDPGDDGAVV